MKSHSKNRREIKESPSIIIFPKSAAYRLRFDRLARRMPIRDYLRRVFTMDEPEEAAPAPDVAESSR